MDRLNYFTPYSRGSRHEDQLTRAFLAVLRLVPSARMAFIDLVRQKQAEIGADCPIPPMTDPEARVTAIRTQVHSLGSCAGQLVSILLTDERWESDKEAGRSDRTARYDGVIEYAPDFVLIIENKPHHEHVWPGQLDPGADADSDIKIDKKLVEILWRDIISCLSNLISSGNTEQPAIAALGGTQVMIIDDFLSFVWENFSFLNPYDRFESCRGDVYLLRSRCRQILDSLTEASPSHHPGWEDVLHLSDGPAAMVTLHPTRPENKEWELVLALYPGATISQARRLYAQVDEQALARLTDDSDCNCEVRSNLTFSFVGKSLVWVSPDSELADIRTYVRYWKDNPGEIRQVARDSSDFEDLFTKLREVGLISEEDRNELRKKFTETKRTHIRICPSIAIEFRWSSTVACRKDNALGELRNEIVQKTQLALSAWGQKMVQRE